MSNSGRPSRSRTHAELPSASACALPTPRNRMIRVSRMSPSLVEADGRCLDGCLRAPCSHRAGNSPGTVGKELSVQGEDHPISLWVFLALNIHGEVDRAHDAVTEL